MQSRGLQLKLAIIFIAVTIMILMINDLLIYWNTSLEMENQLGANLEAIAAATASQVDETLLLHLLEINTDSRTRRNMQMRLDGLARSTGVSRIYLFNQRLENLVDSADEYPVGVSLPQLMAERREIEKVFEGKNVASTLFEGFDNKLYKSGFAPIRVGNGILAATGVDASANFLITLRDLRNKTLLLGIFCILGAVIAAIIFSRTLVHPLMTLVGAAHRIGRGKLDKPIPVSGTDEIGFLGKTMEEMRKNILKRDQQLTMVIASIAHEIRNPLAGIELFAELAQSNLSKEDENYHNIQKIIKESRKLKSTLTDFLEYAKPSAPETRPCVLKEIVEQVRPFLEKDLAQNQVKIEYRNSQDEKRFLCDERHCIQIFHNLLQNSIHAMPGGGIIIVEEEWRKNNMVCRISDKGKGIREELRSRIFDPFITTKEKGTGLGLAIVKKLIQENGGEIELVSSGEDGTTFQLLFPAAA